MPTITDIRTSGTDLVVLPRPLYEPLDAPSPLKDKLVRFGDNYNTSRNSNLYQFLLALCGEAGAGSLKKGILYPRLQSSLEATHFTDLDRLYGEPLGLPRLSEEIYPVDPRSEALTQDQWTDVYIKDSQYRARCLLWMRAILLGSTPEGIRLAAEAACGIECNVIERYQYIENAASDRPTTLPNIGLTSNRNEFVVVPKSSSLTQEERRRIARSVDKIRPLNTIPTVVPGNTDRTPRAIRNQSATSEGFSIQRFVTGRTDVNWPPIDLSQGLWIDTTEREAPTFAFEQAQETVTYLTIVDSSASSEHMGPFNKNQRSLFVHLSQDTNPFYLFDSSQAYTNIFAPIQLNSPWISSNNITLINTYYPITYFSDPNLNPSTNSSAHFWSSEEKLAPESDYLILDLGRTRPFNFVDLEIGQKPVDIKIQWSTDNIVWNDMVYTSDFQAENQVQYLPSLENSWAYTEHHFNLVQTRYVKLIFTRREDPFPLSNSIPFLWSIDVRNLRLMHVIADASDFVADVGTDILGNSYRTDITHFPAENATDGDDNTFWRSQANPSRFAVEAMYFDLRINSEIGYQSFLELFENQDLNTRSQSDLETYFTDGVVIDEIFIDPITFGPNMHIYYSLDDTPDWDNKLWIPINRHYILKRGYFALPSSTLVKYVKIEFSNLTPIPYNIVTYPNMPQITYRKYPTWVQNYFQSEIGTSTIFNPLDIVSIDPLKLGFQVEQDLFNSGLETREPSLIVSAETEIANFIEGLVFQQQPSQTQTEIENQIKFNSPFMFNQDLIAQLDSTRALSRVAAQGETSWNAELPPITEPAPTIQSVTDLSASQEEKETPVMYFPYRCRHGYQVIEAFRQSSISYYVGLREVSFHRREYTVSEDEDFYIETFGDDAHILSSDFIQDDWRFVVTP